MNYELQKLAHAQHGFNTRLKQLVLKSASNGELVKSAVGGLARMNNLLTRMQSQVGRAAQRVAPRIEPVPAPAGINVAGGLGDAVGQIGSAPFAVGGWLAKKMLGNPGASGGLQRFIGGVGKGFLKPFGETGKRWGNAFDRAMTGNVKLGPLPTASAADVASGAAAAPKAAPVGAAATPAATPTAAPGTIGGGTTPGFMTNEQLAELGLVTPNRGFTMPGRGLTGPGVDPSILGDPTKGLLGRISGMLPQSAQNWIAANPNLASAAGGALAGGGLMYAGDAYGDHKRRQALANLGMLDRLGLAFQLATNPQGFSNTLRL